MFERFTREARATVTAAVEEAAAAGAPSVGCTHLVVAAARAVPGIDADALRRAADGRDALATLGIDVDEVRRRAEEAFGPGALERGSARRHSPLGPSARKALELSLREAIRLHHRAIGPEHVVLGALRTRDPQLEAALRRAGYAPAELRATLESA